MQALVYRLAGFLAHHKRAELCEMLETARLTRSNPPALAVSFDVLAAQLPPLPVWLCFDDFHLVETDAHLQAFLQRLTASGKRRVKLLLTTRRHPSFLTASNQGELGGLSLADAEAFLAQREVALPEALMTALHDVTGGNPTFLTLAAVALQASNRPADLIAQLARVDDIERFLMVEVNAHLSGDEQRVMEAVAIFKGRPAARAALEHVLEQLDVRRVLRELEDQFLLTAERRRGERRYSQHQIIEAFYYDQPRHDRRLALHSRAADYFERLAPAPFPAVQQYALAGEALPALRVAKENLRAIVNEGLATSLLQILENVLPLDLDPRAELERQLLCGKLHARGGDYDGARRCFEAAAALLDDLPAGLSPQRVNALKNLGAVAFNLGRLEEAATYSERALAMSRQLRDHLQTARVLINLGPIKYVSGDWQGAIDDLEEGLALAERLGSLDVILSLHTNLGGMYVEKGDHEQAFAHLNEVLRLAEGQHTHQVVTARIRLGPLHNVEAQWEAAAAMLEEAETLARQINDQASLASTCVRAGCAKSSAILLPSYLLSKLDSIRRSNLIT